LPKYRSVSGKLQHYQPKKIRNAKIQQTEFTNKILNKKTNEMIHSEQMQVVPEPKSNSNDFTTMLSITIICLKGHQKNLTLTSGLS
jgi:hypothetical protein